MRCCRREGGFRTLLSIGDDYCLRQLGILLLGTIRVWHFPTRAKIDLTHQVQILWAEHLKSFHVTSMYALVFSQCIYVGSIGQIGSGIVESPFGCKGVPIELDGNKRGAREQN